LPTLQNKYGAIKSLAVGYPHSSRSDHNWLSAGGGMADSLVGIELDLAMVQYVKN